MLACMLNEFMLTELSSIKHLHGDHLRIRNEMNTALDQAPEVYEALHENRCKNVAVSYLRIEELEKAMQAKWPRAFRKVPKAIRRLTSGI
eukprot:scaffold175785_cov19-Tisochrysis_lutea.AAC.5